MSYHHNNVPGLVWSVFGFIMGIFFSIGMTKTFIDQPLGSQEARVEVVQQMEHCSAHFGSANCKPVAALLKGGGWAIMETEK